MLKGRASDPFAMDIVNEPRLVLVLCDQQREKLNNAKVWFASAPECHGI